MDNLGNVSSGPNAALVILSFLQADCRSEEYSEELLSLEKDLHLARDINANGPWKDGVDTDGVLETDGHSTSNIRALLNDLQPSVELRNLEVEAVRQVAEELREIAAQLEHSVVAQATQNLCRKISNSPFNQWKGHLRHEVERVMRQGVGLEHLAQERVDVALVLTLVKAVCEQAPRLLRGLFNVALQYMSSGSSG